MSRIGLSGKSFIPLLSSFACAIPGIMAARVIENRRDRLITILVAPLMTCSARLPVYMLLIGVLIPDRRYLGGWLGLQGLTLLSMYLLGILAAVVMALLLRRTVLQGQTPPFVMELPSYKLPSVRVVGHRVLERGWAFVRRAGTVILATSVVVWALAYFPRAQAPVGATASAETAAGVSAAEQIRQSYLGRAGQFVEPVVRPLGWDWRIGCATLASFPARELIVSTLGVIFELGDDQDEESHLLRDQVRRATWEGGERPLFTIPVALSIMVFFALCAQCAATLAVIRRETNSWRWPLFTFAYMTLLAYVGALITFQVSVRLIG